MGEPLESETEMPKRADWPKMKPEWKKKWLKALRGGVYKQGYERLKAKDYLSDSTYCCLGVLADVQGSRWKRARTSFNVYMTQSDEMYDLSERRLKRLGLSPEVQERLIKMNDGDGMRTQSFRQIANWIERNL